MGPARAEDRVTASNLAGNDQAPCSSTARMMEIVENLHRQDLTPEEAALQRAEYARLSAVERGELAPDDNLLQLGGSSQGRAGSGIDQAAKETGVSPTQLRRDIVIASLTPEQRAAARPANGKPATQARSFGAQACTGKRHPKSQETETEHSGG
jgi:ParB-like chromosome segregation protein Spo0J